MEANFLVDFGENMHIKIGGGGHYFEGKQKTAKRTAQHKGVMASLAVIGVNRPAFGGTVPHFHQMSRVPRNETDVPHLF